MMDEELKKQANPFIILSAKINKTNELLERANDLSFLTTEILLEANELNLSRNENIDAQHEEWRKAKRKDERVSKIAVILGATAVALASLALYHDVISIDPILIAHIKDYMRVLR
tara:strand:- start:36 stop:380 length:345 start_codon:yes stop_codon:yes gene_type:complete